MLLRVSSQEADLEAALSEDDDADPGVPAGVELRHYARYLLAGADDELRAARELLSASVGPAGVSEAACVAAFFNALDRVADATGTELDAPTRMAATVMLTGLGLEALEHREEPGT